MKRVSAILLFLAFSCLIFAQETILQEAIEKIKSEGLTNSGVEEIAYHLIDESGPRLSNSPGYNRASEWAVKQLSEWGLENAKKEAWGEFGKGWEVNKSYVAMTKPYYMPFIAVPKAWSPGSMGPVSGKVVFVEIEKEEDFEKYKGQLKGAIIAVKPTGDAGPTFEPDAVRYTEGDLSDIANPSQKEQHRYTPEMIAAFHARRALSQKMAAFFKEEGASLLITGRNGRHGTVFTSSPNGYSTDSPEEVAELETAPEHVSLMARLIANGEEVEIEAEVKTTFFNQDLKGYNVVAEIPGIDKNLKDEVVMLGGHLDSWHGATGATDNAAGCIVMMEAIRILQEAGLQPKRTIRIALWGGEEQGIFGSRNYVKNHFGDSETMQMTEEHAKLSAYYNIDNGTGRIRGIYLQGNESARPIFEKWFEPFDDIIDNTTITIRDTGGTDHLAFDGVGLPGFQFIQDRIEYRSRTHHTNMDTYERLVIDDLKQIAVIVASFVYQTAQRDELMPRKPGPEIENR